MENDFVNTVFAALPLKVRQDDYRTRLRLSTYLNALKSMLNDDAEDFFLTVFSGVYAEIFAANLVDKSREFFNLETDFQYKELAKPLRGYFIGYGVTPAWAKEGVEVKWRAAFSRGGSVKNTIKKKLVSAVSKGIQLDDLCEMISDITCDLVWILKKEGALTSLGEIVHGKLFGWCCYSTFVDLKTGKTLGLYPFFTPQTYDFLFSCYLNEKVTDVCPASEDLEGRRYLLERQSK